MKNCNFDLMKTGKKIRPHEFDLMKKIILISRNSTSWPWAFSTSISKRQERTDSTWQFWLLWMSQNFQNLRTSIWSQFQPWSRQVSTHTNVETWFCLNLNLCRYQHLHMSRLIIVAISTGMNRRKYQDFVFSPYQSQSQPISTLTNVETWFCLNLNLCRYQHLLMSRLIIVAISTGINTPKYQDLVFSQYQSQSQTDIDTHKCSWDVQALYFVSHVGMCPATTGHPMETFYVFEKKMKIEEVWLRKGWAGS